MCGTQYRKDNLKTLNSAYIQPSDFKTLFIDKTSVTIGNFDGCHLGHQKLIKETIYTAKNLGAKSAVVSFSPRPDEFFSKQSEAQLFTRSQKERAFKELGLDYFLLQKFDQEFAQQSAEQFYQAFLIEKLNVKALTIGPNFYFGYRRSGNAQWLKQKADSQNLICQISDPQLLEDKIISSTWIKSSLKTPGQIAKANSMLGRPYLLEGHVAEGRKLGRKLGFPTLNFTCPAQLIPHLGVYAGWVMLYPKDTLVPHLPPVLSLPNDKIPAAVNIGTSPTVDKHSQAVTIEAHLIDFSAGQDSLYGLGISLYLKEWLRDEIAFDSLEILREQIKKDTDKARSILQSS